MFTIEHEFTSTTVTLVDEGDAGLPLQPDVIIHAAEDGVTLEQTDPETEQTMYITLSMAQLTDLRAALNLPEGSYRLSRDQE